MFASGKDKKTIDNNVRYLHTNFKISRSGETILLTDEKGNISDSISTGVIPVDFSFGRNPNDINQWVLFHHPTPTVKNSNAFFNGYVDTVYFSQTDGFYNGTITLTLSTESLTTELRYTLNGDNLSPDSPLYSDPIQISQTTVVKAQSFNNDIPASRPVIQTYFINESFTFPVISLSTPPDNLWDPEFGIYTPGRNADESNRIANYWQDWERPIHIEFYESDGQKGFEMNAGVKIFGWGSRANTLKGLAIMIRDRYGTQELDYPLFPELPITKFKSFILRAGASDWQGTYFRDLLCNSLIDGVDIDKQAFQPAILFINGDYLGIHNIQEKLNEDYLASHHHVDKENVDIISRYWRRDYPIVIEGDVDAYLEMEDFLKNHNLNDSQNYEIIQDILDVNNYINYCVTEIYCANYDWPGNNNKCWRSKDNDGKWRSLFYDLDYTFNSNGINNYTHNTLEHATMSSINDWPNPPETTFLLRSMMTSKQFQNDFINRSADFLNTRFKQNVVAQKIKALQDLFEPEMERHIQMWGSYSETMTTLDAWKQNINDLFLFASYRPAFLKNYKSDYFNLNGVHNIELNLSQSNAGTVKINSIVPDAFPWKGDYFDGIPIQIKAYANPGFIFSHWEGVPEDVSIQGSISLNISNNKSIKAIFLEDTTSSGILFNEINYNSSPDFDPEDWTELYNPGPKSINISGWIFKDEEDDNQFIIPDDTLIPAKGYLVLSRNITKFTELFPEVPNVVGNIDFGLSSKGDRLRLFNQFGHLIDSLTFKNRAPWPIAPNGYGPTLILKAPNLNNSIAENWTKSNNNGSPGLPNIMTSEIDDQNLNIPNNFILNQNYPNPFNGMTTICFSCEKKALTSLIIYNINGRVVKAVFSKIMNPGRYSYQLNLSDLPSGIYFYQLKQGTQYLTKKMIYIK